MKITRFKKTNNDKYKLYLDNGDVICLYEDVIINNNLLITKAIDEKMISKLTKENNETHIYGMALNYLSIRMRSKKELYEYLIKKEVAKNLIDKTIDKLIKNGYLNDYVFAKAYVNDKFTLSNDGPFKIKNSLISLGVEDEIINEILDSIDKNSVQEKLATLIEKKLKSTKGSYNALKIKLLNYFYNLGYDKKDILEILNNVKITTDLSFLKKEYDKLNFKYSKKYDGKQLELFVEQKLYSKGYTKEDIESVKKEN